MRTVAVAVPTLAEQAEAGDLESALTGLSGVARAEVDVSHHTVTVDYEPDYVSPELITLTIERAGYPINEKPG